ncbi:hypothetical protein CB0940_11440 [Cercospora beticola]|uniref:Uncharacterized protein n=1 Tax=Cercospora beticola TaxID=122368 RepID=A0A2G5HEC6_CERBT|nr:hypothetical protein CB0940_11440 [Cercospora beticola]PIA90582.1 hypothetical protein CB0940_11440 [Cercospora beticola]
MLLASPTAQDSEVLLERKCCHSGRIKDQGFEDCVRKCSHVEKAQVDFITWMDIHPSTIMLHTAISAMQTRELQPLRAYLHRCPEVFIEARSARFRLFARHVNGSQVLDAHLWTEGHVHGLRTLFNFAPRRKRGLPSWSRNDTVRCTSHTIIRPGRRHNSSNSAWVT